MLEITDNSAVGDGHDKKPNSVIGEFMTSRREFIGRYYCGTGGRLRVESGGGGKGNNSPPPTNLFPSGN